MLKRKPIHIHFSQANLGTLSLTKYALRAQGLVAIPVRKLIVLSALCHLENGLKYAEL